MGLVGVWLALGLDEIVPFLSLWDQVAEKYAENFFLTIINKVYNLFLSTYLNTYLNTLKMQKK